MSPEYYGGSTNRGKMDITDTRPFPIQGETARNPDGTYERPIRELPPCTIPWWLAEIAYKYYVNQYGTGQSLERLAERAGFGRSELISLIRQDKLI